MGEKSRWGFVSDGCVGCLDNGTSRCKKCLGRPQDKRRACDSKTK